MPDNPTIIEMVNGSRIIATPTDDEWTSMSFGATSPVAAGAIDAALDQMKIMFEHPRFFWAPIDPDTAIRCARARDMRHRRPLRSHRRAMQHLALQRRYGGSHEQRMRRRFAE